MPATVARHPQRRVTAEGLALLPPQERQAFLSSLTDREKAELEFYWPFWARPKQVAPEGNWRTWLILAGRGFGKTRTGAEWIRQEIESGRRGRLALVARTSADARDVIVEGQSGILNISPPWNKPRWIPSKRRLQWANGAVATIYSADEPDLLRGPEHDGAWCDELASWRYPEAWDMLMFGLRLGPDPRAVVTTTPKPVKLVRDLMDDPNTVVTRGSSYENRGNLAPMFFDTIVGKYEGSRLGRQELLAEILDDNPNALFHRRIIDRLRLTKDKVEMLDWERVVVAVDPSVHDGEDEKDPILEERSECGIVVGAVARMKNNTKHAYILDDVSTFESPAGWGAEAVRAYRIHAGDRIVGEVNNGGAMVEHVIRSVDKTVSFKAVRASRGKVIRAEPVSALYERGLVHHVGNFPELEDQMCDWMPGEKSPDRLDALVWCVTELLVAGKDRALQRYQ